jgi:hypothetical protein
MLTTPLIHVIKAIFVIFVFRNKIYMRKIQMTHKCPYSGLNHLILRQKRPFCDFWVFVAKKYTKSRILHNNARFYARNVIFLCQICRFS